MSEYRLFFLTHGQKPPTGTTGIMLANGGIMWIGDNGTFQVEPTFGSKTDSDPDFSATYNNRTATQDEIDEYDYILANPIPPEW